MPGPCCSLLNCSWEKVSVENMNIIIILWCDMFMDDSSYVNRNQAARRRLGWMGAISFVGLKLQTQSPASVWFQLEKHFGYVQRRIVVLWFCECLNTTRKYYINTELTNLDVELQHHIFLQKTGCCRFWLIEICWNLFVSCDWLWTCDDYADRELNVSESYRNVKCGGGMSLLWIYRAVWMWHLVVYSSACPQSRVWIFLVSVFPLHVEPSLWITSACCSLLVHLSQCSFVFLPPLTQHFISPPWHCSL